MILEDIFHLKDWGKKAEEMATEFKIHPFQASFIIKILKICQLDGCKTIKTGMNLSDGDWDEGLAFATLSSILCFSVIVHLMLSGSW